MHLGMLGEGADAHGFETERWTLLRIAVVIRAPFTDHARQTLAVQGVEAEHPLTAVQRAFQVRRLAGM